MNTPDDLQHDHSESGFPRSLCTLSPADQRVFDALMKVGFERSRLGEAMPGAGDEDRRRAACIMRLLGLMDDYPIDDAEPPLLHATLARIDRYEDQVAARFKFDVHEEAVSGAGGGRRIRVPDFISVAAVLLIGAGVFWPVLEGVRQRSIDDACANNMRTMAYAFGQYAADYDGSLPVSMAGMFGSWDPQVNNVLNLKPLIEGDFCEAGHLNCPGHAHSHARDSQSREPVWAPSYSYRVFGPGGSIRWNADRVTVILGDLNPLIDAARDGWAAPPLSVSVNHRGRGQNVLASDGATMWLQQPVIGRGDNIWMPNNAQSLTPGLMPEDEFDVFLAQ